MTNKQAWVVMSVPGDDREPTSWYAYNRNTLEQIKCDDRNEASRIVQEMRLLAFIDTPIER